MFKLGYGGAPVHPEEVEMTNLKAKLYHVLPLLVAAAGVIVETENGWRTI